MPTQSAGHASDLVLVAVMPNQRDLEIARVLGWYRIPLKSAPKVISVDYLAFYQTGAFPPEEHWQIRWIAPILGHELTTRAELLHDQPNHPRADEEYFKLQLGPLEELAQPIPAGSWKRVTFFYTTLGRVWQAESLADLPSTMTNAAYYGSPYGSVRSRPTSITPLSYPLCPLTRASWRFLVENGAAAPPMKWDDRSYRKINVGKAAK